MRDEEDCACVAREKILQPVDRIDVQMVCRLVEEQQIGLADQRARQQDAAAPAARESVDDDVALEIQSRQDQIHMMLAHPCLVFIGVMRVPFRDNVEYRPVCRQGNVLLQARDPDPGLAPHGPCVGRNLAADDLQQRRLAGAVPADDGDPFARVDLQRDCIEQRQMPERDRDPVQRDQRHPATVPRVGPLR